MKLNYFTLLVLTASVIAACHSTKKTTTSSTANSTAAVPTATVAAPTTTAAVVKPKSWTGIYEPGEEELTAIKAQYNDVTMEHLKQGYVLYAQSACVSCHNAKGIYQFDVMRWKLIIDNMAREAKITDIQKDAVYKYVLAIKATQPK